MSYSYDYTRATTQDSAVRQYWRMMKMALTRCVRTKTFRFDGNEYEYLYHPYNRTWKNERGVEIPIFRELLLLYQGKRVLEIGNVLGHYFAVSHDIVDKYEVAPGVINQDVISFEPVRTYDLIVSISTLEHVGWDERPREPHKLLRTIEHLKKRCLAPGGTMMTSLPLGYNAYFDGLIENGQSPFTTQHFLKRISKKNYWVESNWEGCRTMPYGRSVANALCIGIIRG